MIQLNGQPVVSFISEETKEQLFPQAELCKTELKLRSYTAQPIKVLGRITVRVSYKEFEGTLPLHVVSGSGPPLLGRDWLEQFRLDWTGIRAVRAENTVKLAELLEKHKAVFRNEPGVMTKHRAHLTLEPGARPVFRRPHSVPFAMKDKVGRELDRLEEAGILQRVEYSPWVVVVHKKDGSIRLCGNYKLTINPCLLVDQYPLPKPADLMTCLTGGQPSWICIWHTNKCRWMTSQHSL